MTRTYWTPLLFLAAALGIATNARAQQMGGLFVENRGQWDSRAHFLYAGADLNMWIITDGVVYDIPHAAADNSGNAAKSIYRSGDVIRMKFEQSSFAPRVRGIQKAEGSYNYFIGNDSRRWATDVSLYNEVKIEGLYSGIDAVFYRDRGHPRYDLVVAPGADLADVRIRFEGGRGARITPEGNLAIATSAGELQQRGLFAYQEYGGVRREVACRFVAHEKGSIGFEAGAYDRSRPLVVDPIIYSTLIGGLAYDRPSSLAFDSEGNWILSGQTSSQDFPITTGAYDSVNVGSVELFVAKFSADGKHLLFSTFLGGSGQDDRIHVALGRDDYIHITGHTYSTDFVTTKGAFDRTYNDGDGDAYVVKMNSDGNALVFATYLGGNGGESGTGIAVDTDGSIYVAGGTDSRNFITTPGAYNRESGGAFVVKMSSDGDSLLYSTMIADDASAIDMRLDAERNVYIVGSTRNPDFPTTSSAFDRTYNGNEGDVFALKLNADGSALIYSTFIGGSGGEYSTSMELDADGNVYLTGYVYSSDYPTTPGAYDRSYNQGNDFFVTKLNPSGSDLVFSTFLGGTQGEYNQDLAIDAEGNIYLTGTSSSDDFPVTSNALDSSLQEWGHKAVVAKLDPSGSRLLYSSLLGGARGNTEGEFVTIDSEGYVLIVGETAEADFPRTTGAFDTTYKGAGDVFITKFLITDEVSGVEPGPDVPDAGDRLQLSSVAPNPAREGLEVGFRLSEPGRVRMELFSLDGECVAVPVASRVCPAGEQKQSIALGNIPAGVYLLRVSLPGGESDQRSVVVR